MTTAAKKKFDSLRERYGAAYEAARDEQIRQAVKYGSERDARSWGSRGDKTRLEKLEKKRNKLGSSIVDLIVKTSPRGETWMSGAPSFWLQRELPWEDVIRPASEPLSALPPPAWGWSERDIAAHFAPVLPPGTRGA